MLEGIVRDRPVCAVGGGSLAPAHLESHLAETFEKGQNALDRDLIHGRSSTSDEAVLPSILPGRNRADFAESSIKEVRLVATTLLGSKRIKPNQSFLFVDSPPKIDRDVSTLPRNGLRINDLVATYCMTRFLENFRR